MTWPVTSGSGRATGTGQTTTRRCWQQAVLLATRQDRAHPTTPPNQQSTRKRTAEGHSSAPTSTVRAISWERAARVRSQPVPTTLAFAVSRTRKLRVSQRGWDEIPTPRNGRIHTLRASAAKAVPLKRLCILAKAMSRGVEVSSAKGENPQSSVVPAPRQE